MHDVAEHEGRTVLFVSHNMAAVKGLCERGLLLQDGSITCIGESRGVVETYMHCNIASSRQPFVDFERPAEAEIWMTRATLLVDGKPGLSCPLGAHLSIQVQYESAEPTRRPRLGVTVYNSDGNCLINTNNRFQMPMDPPSAACEGVINCQLGLIPLVAGRYHFTLWLGDTARDHHIEEYAFTMDVVDRDIWGTGKTPPPATSSMWWPAVFST